MSTPFANYTPPPWQWFTRANGDVYLATPDRGHLTVMDFVRRGMSGAQPRFATWKGDERTRQGGIMMPASSLDLLIHPDAKIVAASAAMYEACKRFRTFEDWKNTLGDENRAASYLAALEQMDAAIALAEVRVTKSV